MKGQKSFNSEHQDMLETGDYSKKAEITKPNKKVMDKLA